MSRNYQQEVDGRQREITQFINSRNYAQAVKIAVQNPPFGCQDENLKLTNLNNILLALSQVTKENDIKAAVASFSSEELDVLMKYIYAGLANPNYSSSLFKWHPIVVEQSGGLGCIVRVITDKVNTVI